ncbi:hypothetical protein LY78DRAFT_721698 [Colletotrichum sublineola]|nr:hypothetical protein LY78DRAFT_721698 [Colletotrichum sublineola]
MEIPYEGLPQQPISDKARKSRDRAWKLWEESCNNRNIDPCQIWLDLCLEKQQAETYCQKFLKRYIVDSVALCPTIGEGEVEEVQQVKATRTMARLWQDLIEEADERVLNKKRRDNPLSRHQWQLRCPKGDNEKRYPAGRIHQFIKVQLTEEFNLTRKQQFVKRETTSEDIISHLITLWSHAGDIPCDPRTRIWFHFAVILAGLGGFRPGVYLNVKYRDVVLSVVRDPANPHEGRLCAEVTVHHNKKMETAVRQDQSETLTFSITLIPCLTLCFLTNLTIQALLDDAFEAGYQSFEEVLRRPTLENVDYVKLGWKKCFEDKPIFPIAQAAFWKWWVTVQRVSGCREPTRPYSARVGAAQELNGALVPSLRNYVMSNSSAVFEKSYLPRQFPRCLASIAFKAKAGDSEDITKVFRDAKLKNDIHAPLYVSAERLRSFEERNDVREQRKKLEVAAKSDPQNGEVQRLRASLNSYLETLKREALKEEREKYFKEADTLRSRGLSTDYLRQTHTGERPKRRFGATADMATAIGEILKQEHNDISQVRVRYAAMVLAYLRFQPTARVFDKDRSDYEPSTAELPSAEPSTTESALYHRCFICYGTFSGHTNLRKHTRDLHRRLGLFDNDFSCPECMRSNQNINIPNGLQGWRDHVKAYHPDTTAPTSSSRVELCLLCDKRCTSGVPMMKHFIKQHVEKEKIFATETGFDCNACFRSNNSTVRIQSQSDWYCHVATKHCTEPQTRQNNTECAGRRNGISIDLVIPGEDSHVVGNKHPRADEDTMLEVIWPSKKKWKGPSESPPSDAMFFSTRIDDVASSEDTMVMDPRLVQIQAALRCEEPSWAVGESHVHTEYFQAA